jgi:hypothetical protein
MKKSMRTLIALMLLLVITLSGCGKGNSPKFTIGTWNGNVFENSWLNMKFEIDDEWTIASDEKIAEYSGIGQEILGELQGTSKESLEAMADLTTVYGFMALKGEGDPSIQLIFENLAKTIEGTKTTEEEYLDIMLETLLELGYEVVEEATDVKLADKTFKKLKLSAYNGLLVQDFYCYKKGKYMVGMVTSYTKEKASEVETVFDKITTLK